MAGYKNIDPELGKNTRFTSENAREMQARSVDARNAFAKRREILLSQANLTPESKKFWAKFGFEGDNLAFVTNDMKAEENGLKKAIEKGELDKIVRLFASWGITAENETPEDTGNITTEFIVTRLGNGSDKANP